MHYLGLDQQLLRVLQHDPLLAARVERLMTIPAVGTVLALTWAGRGIYHGAWQPSPNGLIVHAYSDTDLLKDASGKQRLLTWYTPPYVPLTAC
jgi:hypothetical protein